MIKKKIIIGTAQFGQNYGISNKFGKTNYKVVKEILSYAKKKKVLYLDTSSEYGDAESVLGKADLKNYKVITKFTPKDFYKNKVDIKKTIINKLIESRKKLQVKKIYAVLLHNSEFILKNKGNEIYNSLKFAKKVGLISKFGYSIYSFSNLVKLCEKYRPDMVQCPYNIFDRRLVNQGGIKYMKRHRIEIHVRSVFLQGLLLMPLKDIPSYFLEWKNLFKEWNNWLLENKSDPLQSCLNFVLKTKGIDKVVIGVNDLNQLKQILKTSVKKKIVVPKNIQSTNKNLIYPSLW